jgi:predicted nucleic acid-binding protein
MKAYVDTSALLRIALREESALEQLRRCEQLVSSELLPVESARTLHRLRLKGALTLEEVAARTQVIEEWLEGIDIVLLRAPILRRASEPLPTALGTLDAIHLATALVWRDRQNVALTIATHDAALATAARAFGFDVVGA